MFDFTFLLSGLQCCLTIVGPIMNATFCGVFFFLLSHKHCVIWTNVMSVLLMMGSQW